MTLLPCETHSKGFSETDTACSPATHPANDVFVGVDGGVGAELLGEFETVGALPPHNDRDMRRARLACGERAGDTALPHAKDHHGVADPGPGDAMGPANARRDWLIKCSQLRRYLGCDLRYLGAEEQKTALRIERREPVDSRRMDIEGVRDLRDAFSF